MNPGPYSNVIVPGSRRKKKKKSFPAAGAHQDRQMHFYTSPLYYRKSSIFHVMHGGCFWWRAASGQFSTVVCYNKKYAFVTLLL